VAGKSETSNSGARRFGQQLECWWMHQGNPPSLGVLKESYSTGSNKVCKLWELAWYLVVNGLRCAEGRPVRTATKLAIAPEVTKATSSQLYETEFGVTEETLLTPSLLTPIGNSDHS
jgi:hypothetical protein